MKKKRSERRKHCVLAVARRSQKKFAQPQTPSWGRGTAKFNQLGMVTSFTYKSSLVKITQFRVIVLIDLTHTHTNTPPARPLQIRKQTGPITIHCAAKLSAQCNN